MSNTVDSTSLNEIAQNRSKNKNLIMKLKNHLVSGVFFVILGAIIALNSSNGGLRFYAGALILSGLALSANYFIFMPKAKTERENIS